ncbi:MAG: nickel-binding protein [Gaiellaceae bacterium]
MPTFLDHHAMPEMTPEMREGMAERIRGGRPDENGARAVNVYMADGEAYCLSDAPSAEAVVKAHEAAGVAIRREDVVEVTPII